MANRNLNAQPLHKGFLSSAALKYIAVLTMLVDHVAAAYLYLYTSFYDGRADLAGMDTIYRCMRQIGRTAFPIFCFVLVEGFLHTRNLKKYLIRLFLFSLLSEIPFNLAFHSKIWDISSQNVFFTLFIGMTALVCVQKIMQKDKLDIYFRLTLCVISSIAFMWLAYFFKTDYSAFGVLLILIFYVLRYERVMACLIGYISMIWEYWCFPAFLLILGYNGQKGKDKKWFFYAFYPLHLLLLYGLRQALK